MGVGVGTGLAPVLLRRVGARVPAVAGLLAMAAGFAVLALTLSAPDGASVWWLAGGLVVFGLGFGLAITPGTVLILDGLPPERRSVASAVNDLAREVGGVLGIAVLSSALVSRYRDEVATALPDLPEDLREVVDDGAGGAVAAGLALGPEGAQVVLAAQQAFSLGLSTSSWVAAAALGVGAVACLVLVPRGSGGQVVTDVRADVDADVHADSHADSHDGARADARERQVDPEVPGRRP